MQLSHGAIVADVAFDDPSLIVDAGLMSVVVLVEQGVCPVWSPSRSRSLPP